MPDETHKPHGWNAAISKLGGLGSPQPAPEAPQDDFGWWCPTCERRVLNEHVTFEETHDERAGGCGQEVTEAPQVGAPEPVAHPTPWRLDDGGYAGWKHRSDPPEYNGVILDANGATVYNGPSSFRALTDAAARQIVLAVNAPPAPDARVRELVEAAFVAGALWGTNLQRDSDLPASEMAQRYASRALIGGEHG